ncbi:MAG: hypothetical protein IKA72_04335, partial [Clostridia bacterium]|nr:hypothetical protein [Clostridia bacterium]
PLSDSLNRTAECAWTLEDDQAKQTAFTIIQQTKVRLPASETEQEFNNGRVRDEILPYAFLESALLGLDCSAYLSDELKPKANALKDFLGDYQSVVLTKKPNVCGLIRKKCDRLFEVDEYLVELENGKINDVKRI